MRLSRQGRNRLVLSILTGAGDHVTVPDAAGLDITGDLTLDAWVKLNDTSKMGNPGALNVGGQRVIFDKQDDADSKITYLFFIQGDAGYPAQAAPLAFES